MMVNPPDLYPDLSEHDAWWQVYNLMVFSLDEVIEKLTSVVDIHAQGNINYRLPFLIIDDASIDLIKYAWYEEQNIQFAKLFNLARTWSTALIFTTPWIDDLQKFLRGKAWIAVQVQKVENLKETILSQLRGSTRGLSN